MTRIEAGYSQESLEDKRKKSSEAVGKVIDLVVSGDLGINREYPRFYLWGLLAINKTVITPDLMKILHKNGLIALGPQENIRILPVSPEQARAALVHRTNFEVDIITKLASATQDQKLLHQLESLQEMIPHENDSDFLKSEGIYRHARAMLADPSVYPYANTINLLSHYHRVYYAPTNPEGQGRQLGEDTKLAVVQVHHDVHEGILKLDPDQAVKALRNQHRILFQALK